MIQKLCEIECLTREDLADRTGIRYVRLNNVINKRGQVRIEEIEMFKDAFPEYAYWIAFGEELPEAGQISPMTKKAQKDYGKAGEG